MRVRRFTGKQPDRDAAAPLAMTEGSDPQPGEAAEPPRRRGALVRAGLIVLGLVLIFVIGWLGSALVFSPAPLLPEERTVPRVIELPLDDATATLERGELRARVADRRSHPTVPRGVVIWQDPSPETAVPMNTVVQLAVSAGPPSVPVPDITGFALRDALTVLRAAGLTAGEVDTVQAAGEANVVLGTRPGPGAGRTLGGTVGLIVTAGDPPAERAGP